MEFLAGGPEAAGVSLEHEPALFCNDFVDIGE
jgi:hypothetical protein